MIDNKPFLNKLNPVTKLILMIIPTVIVSFSYDLYVPISFFLLILILGSILGQIKILTLLRKMIKFILVGISFSFFILATRALTNDGLNQEIIITAISLCFRIMVFSLTSLLFVLTTDPNEFALSLIHQLKLSHKIVYPFLVAYRFIPTFQDELEKIILAKEVRGLSSNKGFFSNFINLPKYILPLLTSAVRKGERISMSMESRGFGLYEDRTYYSLTSIKGQDYKALIIFSMISIFILIIGINYGLINFNLGLVIN
ncbi:energy-coupling factor transporter transmembrane protein EcfT [Tissierella creatinini]|nr:energy-coupling factor transporter transmembrane protein EcfT [Tissierella creatinini]TJX67253.1 energy-coupling factor transporter transmembrane protein EcfT [Soehngenia saccharolytica]